MKLFVFTRYDELGASSRVRFYEMKDHFQQGFDQVIFLPLINEAQLKRLYSGKGYNRLLLFKAYFFRVVKILSLSRSDLLLIEKELFPFLPAWFELSLLRKRKFALDYDDSIFHNYDLHPSPIIRLLLANKIDLLMKHANLNFCGSHYILHRALKTGNTNSFLMPTVISAKRYDVLRNGSGNNVPVIVWIGTPQTIKYLDMLKNVFKELSKQRKFVFRIVSGGRPYTIDGVVTEWLTWSKDREVDSIVNADIGIMPLMDTPWERGKCGYKLIQYMACGLPVVGSKVGENSYIVSDECGFLASNDTEWLESLSILLDDAELRNRMGKNGKSRTDELYTDLVIGPKVMNLLINIV